MITLLGKKDLVAFLCFFQSFQHCDYLAWGREFDLRLFGFVCFLFLLVSGKVCGL